MKPYYQDDHVTIFHGDCREIIPALPRPDLVLTDPPYGVEILHDFSMGPRGVGKIKVDGKEFPPVRGNDVEFDPQHVLVGGLQILWGANHYAHRLPHNGRWLIWDKRCQIIPPRTQADCELAWCSDYGAARMFYHYWDGMVKQSEQGISREHPTQKPLALMTWCMGFAPDAQLVLDPYMGSGTTLRAVKDLGKRAVGIEIEEAYCEIAARRMRQEVLAL